MSKSVFMATGLLAGLTPSIGNSANLVTNGSFEQVQIPSPFNSANPADIPGWTHTGVVGDALLWAIGYVDGSGSVTVAGEGRQFVTAGAGFNQNPNIGTWTQTVSGLTPGNIYSLSFMLTAEANFSGVQFVDVAASNTSFVAQQFVAPLGATNYWSGWKPYTVNFTANAASTTLSFGSNTSFDVGIDNISLAPAVPEPETYALMLVGLGMVGFIARRKK